MGKNKKSKQLDDVKNSNSPKVTMTDSTLGNKKKRKNKTLLDSTENKVNQTETESINSEIKKMETDTNAEVQQDSINRKADGVSVGNKKKKKKKPKSQNIAKIESCDDKEDTQGPQENDSAEMNTSQVDAAADETKKIKKKKEKQNLGNQLDTNSTVSQENEHATDGKLETCSTLEQNNEGEEIDKKKKKKTKSNAKQESVDTKVTASLEISESDIASNDNELRKKNKRKAGKGTTKGNNIKDSLEEPVKKKQKQAATAEVSEEEQAAETAGKENEKQNTVENDIGQWSTDAFENAERQQKFIKLLGGAKQKDKSFSGIQKKLFSIGMSDVDDFKPGGTTAMSWKQQNNYMQEMETEYERARESHFRRGRGRGFGYRKPFQGGRGGHSGKKSFIDVTKNKSKKFDD